MYKKTLTYLKFGGEHYSPEIGSFSLANSRGKNKVRRTDEWLGCRETFDDHFPTRAKQFLFYSDKNGKNVSNFISEVEKRLKVVPKSKILGFENVNNVCCVYYSPWWKANGARRQLFTILLRCGLSYKNDFNEALYSQEYIENTQEAVERFFKGYTHCTLNMNDEGWVDNFEKEFFLENNYFDYYYDKDNSRKEKVWQKRLERLTKPKKQT